jgi:hypothetical protein
MPDEYLEKRFRVTELVLNTVQNSINKASTKGMLMVGNPTGFLVLTQGNLDNIGAQPEYSPDKPSRYCLCGLVVRVPYQKKKE